MGVVRQESDDGALDDGAALTIDPDEDLTFQAIQHAKRRHGALGGVLAAGMLGLDQAMSGRKPREEVPIVVDANSDPIDVDTDGITIAGIDGTAIAAPPLPRTPPKVAPQRRRWR